MGTNSSKSKENKAARTDKRRPPPATPASPHPQTLSANPQTETIPTVFRWSGGGHHVYISGTFNAWKERIFMSRDRDGFAIILNLPVGRYHYKYIVDDEWRLDTQMPTELDSAGHVNNVIEVIDVSKFAEVEDLDLSDTADTGAVAEYTSPETVWEETRKVPPLLPAQLFYTTLSSSQRSHDPTLLPIPLHVTINHLYFGHSIATTADNNNIANNTNTNSESPSLAVSSTISNTATTSATWLPSSVNGAPPAGLSALKHQPLPPTSPTPLHLQQPQHAQAIHPPLQFVPAEEIASAVNVVGVTERYKNKYATILLYRPYKDPNATYSDDDNEDAANYFFTESSDALYTNSSAITPTDQAQQQQQQQADSKDEFVQGLAASISTSLELSRPPISHKNNGNSTSH